MDSQLVRGGPELFGERLDDLVAIYREAFLELHEPDPARATAERRAHMRRHLDRPDLEVLLALLPGGQLAGFCYSHLGRPGQWWYDVVAAQLPRPAAEEWLGSCRELVELHVRPAWQGHGLGRALLDRAIAGAADARTIVLSALDDPQSRQGVARALYRSRGFRPLLEQFRFPGSELVYAVLGRPTSVGEPRPVAPPGRPG